MKEYPIDWASIRAGTHLLTTIVSGNDIPFAIGIGVPIVDYNGETVYGDEDIIEAGRKAGVEVIEIGDMLCAMVVNVAPHNFRITDVCRNNWGEVISATLDVTPDDGSEDELISIMEQHDALAIIRLKQVKPGIFDMKVYDPDENPMVRRFVLD